MYDYTRGNSKKGMCPSPSSPFLPQNLKYSNRAVTYPNKTVSYLDRIHHYVYGKLHSILSISC